MNEEYRAELLNKISFVSNLSVILSAFISNIQNLEYLVYFRADGAQREYLVVTYRGGASTYVPCDICSLDEILKEIVRNIRHPNTSYVMPQELKEIMESDEWKRLEYKPHIIYTHDRACQILEFFDDLLVEQKIKVEAPPEEEAQRDPDNQLGLYGTPYSDLFDQVEGELVQMLGEKRPDTEITEGIFSGMF